MPNLSSVYSWICLVFHRWRRRRKRRQIAKITGCMKASLSRWSSRDSGTNTTRRRPVSRSVSSYSCWPLAWTLVARELRPLWQAEQTAQHRFMLCHLTSCQLMSKQHNTGLCCVIWHPVNCWANSTTQVYDVSFDILSTAEQTAQHRFMMCHLTSCQLMSKRLNTGLCCVIWHPVNWWANDLTQVYVVSFDILSTDEQTT